MSATAAQTVASSGAVYAQPGVTYTQPTVTYAQPSAVSYTQPTVTYAQPGSVTYTQQPQQAYTQPQVVYAATVPAGSLAPPTYTFAAPQQPQEPTGATVYAAPQAASNYAGAPVSSVSYLQAAQNPQFPAVESMVAYPGMPAPYMPNSVQKAWDNHFDAFGKQDLDQIMLDYDEASVARIYDWTKGTETTFAGTAQIRGMFTNLFAGLSDLSTLEAPVVQVEEFPKTVFLCWKCPGSDVLSCTDTFIFGDNFKIQRQNIVLTAGGAAPSRQALPSGALAPASSAKVASSSTKKTSSSKKSSKKKSKGMCC